MVLKHKQLDWVFFTQNYEEKNGEKNGCEVCNY